MLGVKCPSWSAKISKDVDIISTLLKKIFPDLTRVSADYAFCHIVFVMYLSIKLYFRFFSSVNTYLRFFIGLLPQVKGAECQKCHY